MDDMETFGATYTYGPVSAGIQVLQSIMKLLTVVSRDADTTYMGLRLT